MNRPASPSRRLRRILLLLAASLLAGAAHADWFQLGRNEAMRLYLDDKQIWRKGEFAQLVQLVDFTSAQWVDARTVVGSLKLLVEYDCTAPRSRALASEAFSEQMGEGRQVSREQSVDAPWEAIEPGSTPEKIRQIACGKR